MSIGVKTSTGNKKIHGVHVIPADGYMSTKQIVEALEQDADVSNDKIPFITVYKTDGTYARYLRCSGTPKIFLKGYSFTENATKINCKVYITGTFASREATTNVFPTSSSTFGSTALDQMLLAKMRMYTETASAIHSAIPKKYPGALSNQWFDYDNGEFEFTDLATLTDATTDDYILIYRSGATYYAYRYVGESAPVFEIKSGSNYGAINSQQDYRYALDNALVSSSGRQLDDVVAISGTLRTDTFPIANIIAATFDVKDANDVMLFAKNTDITDFVLA